MNGAPEQRSWWASLRHYGLRVFAGIGMAVMVFAIFGWGVAFYEMNKRPTIPAAAIVQLDLTVPLVDTLSHLPLPLRLQEPAAELQQVISIIERAARDQRVRALQILVDGNLASLAQAQELGLALARFRAEGKRVYAFARSFGELTPGNAGYVLATYADSIWLQPMGMVGLVPLRIEMPFFGAALRQLGITPEFFQRREYKTAMENLTRTQMSPANRAMLEGLRNDLQQQIVQQIARGRGIAPAQLLAAMATAPFTAAEARTLALIDQLGTWEAQEAQIGTDLKEATGLTAEAVGAWDYLAALPAPREEPVIVAVVHASGVLQPGETRFDQFSGEMVLGADTVAAGLTAAAEDPAVRAVILRIDSPGGSVVAAETIRLAAQAVRDADKPLLVSMAGAAASGGYWAALPATKIIALPATLTGSIGVIAGKITSRDLWDKLHVTWEQVGDSPAWSMVEPFTAEQKTRLNTMLDQLYAAFTERVATARQLPPATVEALAGGRVWTGQQAVDRRLVDALGGLSRAVAVIRAENNIASTTPIALVEYPVPPSLADSALQLLRDLWQGQSVALPAPLRGLWSWLAPLTLPSAALMPTIVVK